METKKEFKWFSIFEHEKEQDYLRRMHRSGWRFTRVRGLGMYHFERCEPADVVYQLDYNQEGLAHKEEYVQMFRDCGWTYLQDFAGYSYFCKPASEMQGQEEIFCDDDSRLAMMRRVYRGRLLPLVILFTLVLLPQLLLNALVYDNYILAAVYGGVICTYLAVFAIFGIGYLRYKKHLAQKK